MHWNGGRNKRTIPMHTNTNSPIFRSSIGANNFQVFYSIFNTIHQPKCIACSTRIINDSVMEWIHEQNMVDIISNSTLSKAKLKITQKSDDDKLWMNDPQAELLQ